MDELKNVKLSNGVIMPKVGLGVYKIKEDGAAESIVKEAIVSGYRAIDSASFYENEDGVGMGVKQGIKKAGLKREDIFLTSKVWNDQLREEVVKDSYFLSLRKFGIDYLDLFLVHWPVAGKYKKAWKVLEALYDEGLIRAIGVSNFTIPHLEDLMADARIKPMVNQVECHPYFRQDEILAYCKKEGIQMEAWAPMMQGHLVNDIHLTEIGKKYNKTAAQVALRWNIQRGVVVIPKTNTPSRLGENLDLFDFTLSDEDMERISSLGDQRRVGPDPDNFDF